MAAQLIAWNAPRRAGSSRGAAREDLLAGAGLAEEDGGELARRDALERAARRSIW